MTKMGGKTYNIIPITLLILSCKKFPLNNQELDTSVTNLSDDHWRNVRNTITPAFTAAKMKQVNRCCNWYNVLEF